MGETKTNKFQTLLEGYPIIISYNYEMEKNFDSVYNAQVDYWPDNPYMHGVSTEPITKLAFEHHKKVIDARRQ